MFKYLDQSKSPPIPPYSYYSLGYYFLGAYFLGASFFFSYTFAAGATTAGPEEASKSSSLILNLK